MRTFLDQLYNKSGKKEALNDLSDQDVFEMAGQLAKGVPFATPVFDGFPARKRSAAMLKVAFPEEVAKRKGLTATRTQAWLYDGRTGDQFERPVTVGYMHAQAAPPGGRQDARVRPARTRWSRSSRWAARRSSAASVSARWKCGRWKPTALPTRCRKC